MIEISLEVVAPMFTSGTKCQRTNPRLVKKLDQESTKCQGTTLVVPNEHKKWRGALAPELAARSWKLESE